uniref:Uncharacterized protein n=1 Tax=Oryza rufipogon TaxID=4529 RepID=A0A0E0NJP0_ORYRU
MAFGIAVSCKVLSMHGLPLPAPETSRSIYISEGAMQMSEKKALTLAPDIQEWLAMASELPWHAVAQPTAISVFLPEKANGVPARSMSPVPLASVRLPKGRGAFRQLTFGFSGRGRVSTAADAAAGVDTLLYR